MNRVVATLLPLLAASSLPGLATPKFAVVRVTEVYRNLTSTRSMQSGLEEDRKKILLDERAVHLRKVFGELQELEKEMRSKKNLPVDEAIRKIAQQYEIKRQEAQTLQQDFEVFRGEKNKEINGRMVASMRASLDKIYQFSQKLANEQGFDGAFDSSGNSNTGVPIILYVKNAEDLTPDLIAALKDSGDPSVDPQASGAAPATPPALESPVELEQTTPADPALPKP